MKAPLLISLLGVLLMAGAAHAGCLSCHEGHALQPDDPHYELSESCASCHLGKPDAANVSTAHDGLVASPGELANATGACAGCHAEEVAHVLSGLMHTGRGMVNVTRFTFGEEPYPEGPGDLSCCDGLGDSPADSLLRKRCASCHLGQPRHQVGTDHAIGSRGGGCLACHLSAEAAAGHPVFTRRVRDESCVGCHSRSGRIALNYAGLAEVDDDALQRTDTSNLGYLPDGRLVEQLRADLHHRAGLACIDCHTKRDVMGPTSGFQHGSDAVDIQCQDCHANDQPRITVAEWPSDLAGLLDAIPFPVTDATEFLVTERRGTPLWHVEVASGGSFLHRKLAGGRVPIPALSATHHPDDGNHDRLACSACHSGWAPQCYGCHMEYDPGQEQWDHVDRAFTPGAWIDDRWGIRNDQPPLGVGPHGRIVPFVPGMVRSIEHPAFDRPQFRRLFAPLSPHTVTRGLECAACHRSSAALGLGQGRLNHEEEGWTFEPSGRVLADGMPEDAFVTMDGRAAETTRRGARGLSPEELTRILNAAVP